MDIVHWGVLAIAGGVLTIGVISPFLPGGPPVLQLRDPARYAYDAPLAADDPLLPSQTPLVKIPSRDDCREADGDERECDDRGERKRGKDRSGEDDEADGHD